MRETLCQTRTAHAHYWSECLLKMPLRKGKSGFDQSDVLRFTAEMSVLLKAGLPSTER